MLAMTSTILAGETSEVATRASTSSSGEAEARATAARTAATMQAQRDAIFSAVGKESGGVREVMGMVEYNCKCRNNGSGDDGNDTDIMQMIIVMVILTWTHEL